MGKKNKGKKKNTAAPAVQDASASKAAAEPKPVESKPVEPKPVEEPTPVPVATPAQVSAALALSEEPTPAKPLVLGKSANSSTMDLKDAMKMSPTTEEPAPRAEEPTPKEEPISKKSVESLRKSISKEPEPELQPETKLPEQEEAQKIPQSPTLDPPQETMKDQTPVQEVVAAPAATIPYVPPSTEASSSRPPTGVQDIHTDVVDVKLPEPAHTPAPKKNEIETFDNEESNRPTTSSSSSAVGKTPSAIGAAAGATGRSSTAEERGPKKGDKKEGGFKGLWGRIVAAFK
ncbi:hypothetical protein TWF506_008360 [Arthrobotrys conoides]|uniref:Uncharacterized protein n=1 Tax=Arthrobotrys conoides TaxID=74498 RepID=A0AAN8PFL7_9PEZI